MVCAMVTAATYFTKIKLNTTKLMANIPNLNFKLIKAQK